MAAPKTTPYWWEEAPRPRGTRESPPARADLLVIGSGYTGLAAALETARAGRSTVVVDAEELGFGCSSRNGGQISTSIKPSYDKLSGSFNADLAWRIRREGIDALAFIGDFIAREAIDCDFRVCGRFHAAHTTKYYEELAAAARNQPKGLEVPMHVIAKSEVRMELGTDRYVGGAVIPRHAALDPAKLHNGLVTRAAAAGAELVSHCPVTVLERTSGGFIAQTPKGQVQARDVLVATNGYTGPLTPWHRRRVIPIGSYILATEPLPAETMARLIPKDRVVSDTRRVVIYFRSSPDRRRILFGGRAALAERDPVKVLPRLHAMMTSIFPELAGMPTSHVWVGFVAHTFDTLPHIGQHDGLHFAMGYCGSGVSLATYFGTRIGQQILGRSEGKTALDGIAFPTRPLYWGYPWFLAPTVGAYRVLDRLGL